MIDLSDINKIILKINELEDSKYGAKTEQRIELMNRQLPLWQELYAKIGVIVCKL